MQWWCSASGVAWEWVWRAYPGVWLFVLALGWSYWRLRRRGGPGERRPWSGAAAFGGVFSVWIALDWPLGTLGGGYLLWAHTGQFLLLAMIAPPLLLYGLPTTVVQRVAAGGLRPRLLDNALQPLPAAVTFSAVVLATHIPTIVDGLMVYQVGAFVLDLAWIISGLMFWWPIFGAPPGRRLLSAPARIGYLLVGTFMHMGVGIIMTVIPYPLYTVYEFAPPVGLLRVDDQQRAGGLMLGAGTLIVLTALMVLVYVWMRAEMAAERRA